MYSAWGRHGKNRRFTVTVDVCCESRCGFSSSQFAGVVCKNMKCPQGESSYQFLVNKMKTKTFPNQEYYYNIAQRKNRVKGFCASIRNRSLTACISLLDAVRGDQTLVTVNYNSMVNFISKEPCERIPAALTLNQLAYEGKMWEPSRAACLASSRTHDSREGLQSLSDEVESLVRKPAGTQLGFSFVVSPCPFSLSLFLLLPLLLFIRSMTSEWQWSKQVV